MIPLLSRGLDARGLWNALQGGFGQIGETGGGLGRAGGAEWGLARGDADAATGAPLDAGPWEAPGACVDLDADPLLLPALGDQTVKTPPAPKPAPTSDLDIKCTTATAA